MLKGNIDIDTGKIYLASKISEDFYPNASNFKEATIDHGKFIFTGIANYPLAFVLLKKSGKQYRSATFYVEAGVQQITCHVDSIDEVPKNVNNSMTELSIDYKNAFSNYAIDYKHAISTYDSIKRMDKEHLTPDLLNQKTTLLKNINDEYNNTMLAYIAKHPNSYVAFWKISEQVESGRYSHVIDSMYDLFANTIKNSYSGKALRRKLDTEKKTAIGQKFPVLSIADSGHIPVKLTLRNGAHRYTFIDFWFSHCTPCLLQMPRYKAIYETYKSKGLEIIGISVDNTGAINDWKNAIAKNNLNWPQYLDENGRVANSLNINYFPQNFLLDEHNAIIARNINPEQLESLISK